MTTDPRLLQFADGLFPAGAYAHSFGLETYAQDGRVRGRADLEEFLVGFLEGSAGPCDGAAVGAALRMAQAGDEAGLLALDADLDALRAASELRAASRQMGRQTLRIAAELAADDRLRTFAAHVEAGLTPGHHPLVFGLVGGVLAWPERDAILAYLQAAAAAVVSAALRLLPLGQLEGQKALWAMGPRLAALADASTGRRPADLESFAPGLEIASMHHSRLDARLFRS